MSRETRCKLTGFQLSASSEPGSVSQVPKSPGQLRAASPGFPARLFPGSAPGRHSVFPCCPCPAQLPVPRARCPWVSLTEAVTSPGAQAEPRGTPLGPGLPRDTEPLPTRPWHVRPANSSCPERPGLQPQGSAGRGCGSRVRAWPKPPRALGTAGATRPQVRGCSVPVPVCPSVVGVLAVALCDTGAGQGPR